MKIVKRILLILITFVLGILFIFNLYNIICLNILKQDLTSIAGYGILEVASGSMEPTIHTGDIIIVDTNCDDYQVDDIITFYDEEGSFVTHRIISLDDEKGIITKGDSNNTDDGGISLNQIIGKCVYRISGMGNLLQTLKSPLIMIMIFVVGLLLCVYLSMDKEGNLIVEEEQENDEAIDENKGKEQIEIKEQVIEKINVETTSLEKKQKSVAKKNKEKKSNTTTTKAVSSKNSNKKSSTKSKRKKKK